VERFGHGAIRARDQLRRTPARRLGLAASDTALREIEHTLAGTAFGKGKNLRRNQFAWYCTETA
jgi:hypothetical protein